ncbi:MAG: ATP-binding cassette domain-containing protein [Pseudomonadota bacterium]
MSQDMRLDQVSINLHGQSLLDLDTTIAPGQCLTIMGPSGVGKSSLLAFIGGFLPDVFAASGRVWLAGEEITSKPAHLRRTGLLFQDPLLFPHMNVGENLLFALPAGPDRHHQMQEALASVDMTDFAHRDPATLSGGQRARVALVRVLLSRPRALLLDEPFSKLDTALRAQIRDLVFAEAAHQNLPTVLVTHDQADADAAGGPVIHLT